VELYVPHHSIGEASHTKVVYVARLARMT